MPLWYPGAAVPRPYNGYAFMVPRGSEHLMVMPLWYPGAAIPRAYNVYAFIVPSRLSSRYLVDTLSGRTGSTLVWHSEGRTFAASAASLVICSPARIAVCDTRSLGGTAMCRVGGATSQLDLPSLAPLYVAGCGWLQLGAPDWATSVNNCK